MSIYSDSEYEVSSAYKGSDSDSGPDSALSRTVSPGGEELCSEDYETFEPDKTMSSPMAAGSNEDEDGAQALEKADQIANPSAVAMADDKELVGRSNQALQYLALSPLNRAYK